MLSCAVIGCGPAGMAASTVLRQNGLLVTCFELAPEPGGIWSSSARDVFSSRGLLSPIYPTMRCVLPKDLLSFSDVRFDYTVPQFPHYSAVRHYLHRVAEAKGVHGLARFNTKVESVRYDTRDDLWKLITVNVRSGDVMEWSFDRVCVCTGQTQEARFPKGLKELLSPYVQAGGELHHSSHVKDFRGFRRRRVVVVGDGVSAYDYCVELQRAGAEVYHSTTLTPSAETDPGAEEAADRKHRVRKTLQYLPFSRASSSGVPSRTASDSHPAPSDWLRSVFAAYARRPGWRRDVHRANEAVQRWLRYRNTTVLSIPRVGYPVGCDGKGLLFAPDPTAPPVSALAGPSAPYANPVAPSHHSVGEKAGTDQGTYLDDVYAVICATGFNRRYPFLHPDLRRVLEETQTLLPCCEDVSASPPPSPPVAYPSPLFMGTLLRSNQTMAFVGVQRELLPPFLLFEAQARYIAFAFTGRITVTPTPAKEEAIRSAYPELQDLDSPAGLGLHSAAYYNALQDQLEVSSNETYTTAVMERQRWLAASTVLRLYHKARSMAPLKRKQQHILFSNKV